MDEPPNILICFDTDGIFKQMDYYSEDDKQWFEDGYIAGPIDPQIVHAKILPICEIYVVSESPFYPKMPDGTPMFPVQNDQPSRYLNLTECYNLYWEKYGQDPKTKLYVSDNGDYNEAQKAEFTYIKHDLFVRTMKQLGLL